MISDVLKRMRSIRERERLTGRDVAKKVGISRSFYTLIKNGDRKLSVEILLKIAQALNGRASEILGE